MRGLCIGGLTLVSRARIRFKRKLGVLANRAKTKGSVLLNSIALTLNKGCGTRVLQGKTGDKLMRLAFRVGRRGVLGGLRTLSVCPRSKCLALDHHLLRNQDIDGVGNRAIGVDILGSMTDLLVSVRKRRSGRALLRQGGRLALLSLCKGRRASPLGRGVTSYCRR